MKYMFLIFDKADAENMTPESAAPWFKFGEEAAKVATRVAGAPLRPPETAKLVSVRNGETVVTDGPFIDTKEQLGGFFVYDCPSLDVALEVAAKIPSAPAGYIEVREIVDVGVPVGSA